MKDTEKKKRNYWPPVYGVLLTAYAVYTLLAAFVLPDDVVVLESVREESSAEEISAENVYAEAQTEETKEEEGTASAQEETQAQSGEKDEEAETDEEESANESEEETVQAAEEETQEETETETDEEQTTEAPEEEIVITENSYQSSNISITIETIERYDTRIYIADIQLADASYLRTGLADGTFGRNIKAKTSTIAEENNAILAINGDYYGFREKGFVMREGYLYRDSVQGDGYEDLIIYADGRFEIVDEAESDASALAANGAVQIFSFGPGLIRDGVITVTEDSEVEQSRRSNPRTAIGQIGELHYLMVVSDGRTDESAGLTLLELAEIMYEYGCQNAYNLDGGGSSTMWFMGEIINNPTGGRGSGERRVSDIVYIGE